MQKGNACKRTCKYNRKIYAIYFIIIFDFRKQKLLFSAHKLFLSFHLLDIATLFEQEKVGLPKEEKGYLRQDLVYSFHYQVFYKVENVTEMSCIQ